MCLFHELPLFVLFLHHHPAYICGFFNADYTFLLTLLSHINCEREIISRVQCCQSHRSFER
ncbi:hypothetical protein Hdeb2414_s0009g00327461 [Helianthus debilis subsp. tardiflorus]